MRKEYTRACVEALGMSNSVSFDMAREAMLFLLKDEISVVVCIRTGQKKYKGVTTYKYRFLHEKQSIVDAIDITVIVATLLEMPNYVKEDAKDSPYYLEICSTDHEIIMSIQMVLNMLFKVCYL